MATSLPYSPRRSTRTPAPFSKSRGRRRQPHASQIRRHRFRQADRPVYLGSYNFSIRPTRRTANLLLIRDRRVAVSYTIEALRIFDHYHFRVAQQQAKKARKKLQLARPAKAGEKPCGTKTSPMPARSAIASCSRSGPMRPAWSAKGAPRAAAVEIEPVFPPDSERRRLHPLRQKAFGVILFV